MLGVPSLKPMIAIPFRDGKFTSLLPEWRKRFDTRCLERVNKLIIRYNVKTIFQSPSKFSTSHFQAVYWLIAWLSIRKARLNGVECCLFIKRSIEIKISAYILCPMAAILRIKVASRTVLSRMPSALRRTKASQQGNSSYDQQRGSPN